MKKIPIYILLILVSFVISSCDSKCEKQEITEVYCFVDVTDTINYNLAARYFASTDENGNCEFYNSLKNTFPVQNCSGGIFRIYKINDVGENQFAEMKYPKEGQFSADATEYQIKDDKSLKKFKTSFSKTFDEIIGKETPEKQNTKIFLPVCKALNQLRESKSTRKVMIIFSDMLENSELFSFYKEKSPDATATMDKLEEAYAITFPELKDIEVYIVSKRTTSNDIAIDKAEKFWNTVFKELYPAKIYKSGANLVID